MNELLNGVRVLDLSGGFAGPITSMLLAESGADVIRVERPGGDPLRTPGSLVWTRATRSTTLDLHRADDFGAFIQMLAETDVLLDSYAPGMLDRLGLTEDLLREYPRLVHCSITGYGRTGMRADLPAYDSLVQASTGLMFEQPGHRSGPIFNWIPLPSMGAAMLASCGIAAALRAREHTGRGQRVDTSMLAGVLMFATLPWSRVERPTPGFHATYGCRNVSPTPSYEAGDGQWIHPMPEVVPAVLEHLGLTTDALAGAQMGPCDDRLAWQASVQSLLRQRPAQEWIDLFSARDLRCQPVLSVEEGHAHPQLQAVKAVVEDELPTGERVAMFGEPFAVTEGSSSDAAAFRRTSLRAPLEGIKVLDFGLALAGPFGPMLLSDLGADVIRIDNVNAPRATDNQVWAACQRGKRSITLDLKSDDGRAIVAELVRDADVIHHNMRPGVAERLGIGFEQVRAVRPSIVYCHVTGFGSVGPLAAYPGSDQMAQALSGLEHEQGAAAAGASPTWNRLGICDHAAAMISVVGVVQALARRDRTGQGALIETSILNAASLLGSHVALGEGVTRFPSLDAAQTGLGPLCRLYETAGGWICIAAPKPAHWRALCGALGLDALVSDPRFVDGPSRHRNADELSGLVGSVFAQRVAEEWVPVLRSAGVPCEVPDPTFASTWFDDPDLVAAGLVTKYEHPVLGRTEQLGALWQFSATPTEPSSPPVMHGQHSREILRELGRTDADIDRLIGARVTSVPKLPA